MSTEDYKPNPLLAAIAAALAVIPADPDEPIEEDGYGSLGLARAYGLIRAAAIQVASAKRQARGASPDLDESDDPNVTDNGCGDFMVEWTYNATPWERDSRWAEYRTVYEIVDDGELFSGIDLVAIRAKQEAEKAAEARKYAEYERQKAAEAALRQQTLAMLSPEQRRVLGLG